MSSFSFKTLGASSYHKGRLGVLMTPHGPVNTPAFLFCATKGTLKGLSIQSVREVNTPILLSNTYHLMIQPGAQLVAKMGGLHKFMGWSGPLFTDSGGFQIFSLGHGNVADEIKGKRRLPSTNAAVKMTEEGAIFRSYRDGKRHVLTPESSLYIQSRLGADLITVLDECTPFHLTKEATARSMERSHRWARRSLAAFEKFSRPDRQALYGIVQGGVHEDLRQESCRFVESQPFFGVAIGGSLGNSPEMMQQVVSLTCQQLEKLRPRHLLGIGRPVDILWGVRHGIDTFDCVYPTRLARHGGALIQASYWQDAKEPRKEGRFCIHLLNAHFRDDHRPIDENCPCPTCQTYSRAYLHHLFKAEEILGLTALTIHNMSYMNRLMEDIRAHITGDLKEVEVRWLG